MMERKSYLVVEKSFLEWKLWHKDLRESMAPCGVRHKVHWRKKKKKKDALHLLEDAHTRVCFLLSRPEQKETKRISTLPRGS